MHKPRSLSLPPRASVKPPRPGPHDALPRGTIVAIQTALGVVLHRIETAPRLSPSGVPGVARVRYGARRVNILPGGELAGSLMKFSLDARQIVAVGAAALALRRGAGSEESSEK